MIRKSILWPSVIRKTRIISIFMGFLKFRIHEAT